MRKTFGSEDWKVWTPNLDRINVFDFVQESFRTDPSMETLLRLEHGSSSHYRHPPKILENAKLVGYFTEMDMFELEMQ